MTANAGESARVVLAAALDYIARGWSPIPIPHREKGPLIDAWQDIRVNAETRGRLLQRGQSERRHYSRQGVWRPDRPRS